MKTTTETEEAKILKPGGEPNNTILQEVTLMPHCAQCSIPALLGFLLL